MKWLTRYWNRNRKKIIITIAIIAFIIAIIYITNQLLENSEKKEIENQNRDPYTPFQSIITGEIVSEEITKENTDIIDNFVKYCNNKDYNSAFELLSNDCKEEIFNNNISEFETEYANQNFDNKKTYNLDLLLNVNNTYTYKIKYYPDNILATGGQALYEGKEDYITIIKREAETKLAIKGFIEKNNINKKYNNNNIQIEIKDRTIYKDYEMYNIEIKNDSSSTTSIANREQNKDICLLDQEGVEYSSFLYEIAPEKLTVTPGNTTSIQLRFNKIHSSKKINRIKFNNIIINKQEHETNAIGENEEKIIAEIEI